jgi:serine/threonine-protein kinase Chk1
VKLLINRSSGEAVAMKVIDMEKHPDALTSVRKEVCIHRMLKDPHVVRYYGQRREDNMEYIFLEYAAGGELFDRIGEYSLQSASKRTIHNGAGQTSIHQ